MIFLINFSNDVQNESLPNMLYGQAHHHSTAPSSSSSDGPYDLPNEPPPLDDDNYGQQQAEYDVVDQISESRSDHFYDTVSVSSHQSTHGSQLQSDNDDEFPNQNDKIPSGQNRVSSPDLCDVNEDHNVGALDQTDQPLSQGDVHLQFH